jgi:hypothetical protein
MNKKLTYNELWDQMRGSRISYQMLLNTVEWEEKRKSIVSRDFGCCQKCDKPETMPHYDEEHRHVFHLWSVDIGENICVDEDGGLYDDNVQMVQADKPYHMEVHHKRYIKNRLPWQYCDEDLETLCNWCHWDFHLKNQVEVYTEDEINLSEGMQVCSRCHGAGSFPEYSHIQNGVCFGCGGERYNKPLFEIKN